MEGWRNRRLRTRHPGEINDLGLPAQKPAISTSHQGEAAADEPDGRVPQRRGLPRFRGDPIGAEQAFRYVAIAGAAQMPVERPERVVEALSTLRRRRVGAKALPGRMTPEAHRCGGASRLSLVERDDGRESGSYERRIRDPELMLVPAGSENEMFTVQSRATRLHARPERRGERQRRNMDRTGGEYDDLRRPLGQPKEVGFSRPERGIDCEISTPSAARKRQQRIRDRTRNQFSHDRRDNPDHDAIIPKQDRTSSNSAYKHTRSATANLR